MKTIFCDWDGIFGRRYWKRPQMANQAALSKIFHLLNQKKNDGMNFQFVFITDRPAGQLPGPVWMFHGAEFHAGESGAVIYDRDRNIEVISAEYAEYCRVVVPEIIGHLAQKKLFNSADGPGFEPGGKKVIVSIEPPKERNKNFGDQVEDALSDFEMLKRVRIEKGSAPAISPVDLDKTFALKKLIKLYQEIGKDIDLSNSAWIADNDRDIPLARILAEDGGEICAVNNSSKNYLEFAKSKKGLIVNSDYEQGLLEILQVILC